MKKENPVVWFEIYVDDMERAKNFYETVFDTELSELPNPTGGSDLEMMAFPMTMDKVGGAAGALTKMEGVKAGGTSTIVYFGSDDCAIEEARVESAGGKVFKSKTSIGKHGFIVLATDTEGNMIGVHSMN
ncbi:lactoylglutathione lyase [bacterium]|nr:lactoylglutathione lyase [bacterium]|tara:strand:+ start:559 stop:948 length:390 start_codon:yes stop_codon:yes gene_type:complete